MSDPAASQYSLSSWSRLDWRFLLPSGAAPPVGYFGRRDQELQAALRMLSPSAEDGAASGRSGDAVQGHLGTAVLVRPTLEELRRAVRQCRPGGWVYAEVGRSILGGSGRPRTLLGWRRAFEAAGLESVRMHWHIRTIATGTRIIPLDATAALRRMLRSHEGPLPGRIRVLVTRLALRLRLLPLLLTEGTVIGRRPESAGRSGA